MSSDFKTLKTSVTSAAIYNDQLNFIKVRGLNKSRTIRRALNLYILQVYNVDLTKKDNNKVSKK